MNLHSWAFARTLVRKGAWRQVVFCSAAVTAAEREEAMAGGFLRTHPALDLPLLLLAGSDLPLFMVANIDTRNALAIVRVGTLLTIGLLAALGGAATAVLLG